MGVIAASIPSTGIGNIVFIELAGRVFK